MEHARILVSTSLFAGMTLAGTAAFADDESLRLAWNAPAGCPSGDDVKSATLRSVDPGKLPAGTLEAEASVEQIAPERWRVRLRTRRGESAGEREIEAPTCAGVADATAVILALALVPPTTMEAPPPPARPEPEPEKPKAAPREEPRAHALAAGLSLVGDVGGLPKFGVGGAVTLAWTPWRLRFEAEGKLLGGQTGRGNGASADFSKKEIGGRACFLVLRDSSFDVAPCLGMAATIMSADGRTDEALRIKGTSQTKGWASFDAGVMGRLFLTNWLALRARAEAVVPLFQPDFQVLGTGSVFKLPTIGAVGIFGAEVLFL